MKDASHPAAQGYDADEHLAAVRALCDAVQAAHSALAEGHLVELRLQLARQEELCARLRAALPPAKRTSQISGNVGLAHLQLSRLGLRFAALLRHSRRSADLLSANCQFFLGTTGGNASPGVERHHWSTEV